ncbi:ubiquitin-like domain-containing protein [Schnuerera sp. xch1]|uniref:3D domain-containing protein n=1 Tax=Schnuerera sp. xch1 TaxID=2874283 RepID=UPI001CC0ED76|nr:3D domain-containing protein [Schnuerera sp. xch1]MBZ2175064.1 ubiquitin-like domain-containing protein [Schnuerera sp. xch1]
MNNFSVNKAKALKILTVLAIFASLSLGVYSLAAKDITISIDDEKSEIVTYSNTVEELLKEKGIAFDSNTYINTPLDTKLKDNMNIIIKMPKSYTLTIGNEKSKIKSPYENVEDILKDQDIKLDQKDYTKPALDEKVKPETEIQVIKVKEVIEEFEKDIPHKNLTRKSDDLDIGIERIVQEGQNGLMNVKTKKIFENDKLVKEETIEEEIVKKPIPKITEKGTRNVASSSRGNFRYRKTLTMAATAYDLSYQSTGKTPGDRGYGVTASGTRARAGVVAVDPNVIPLGTKLYVESLDGSKDYGFCTAEDTGGAIKGNKIDLFFSSSSEVKNFGRRRVKVYILH